VKRALWILLAVAAVRAEAQIEELENPGTVTAVQDRLYRMSHELTLGVGMLPLDAFYKGVIGQVAYTFHFNDHFAWQVGRGTYSYNLNTGLRSQLERDFGVQPTAFDEVNWMVGSDLVWSPLYGKVAVLNQAIQHFEFFLIGGLSVLKLSLAQGNTGGSPAFQALGSFRPGLNLGFGLRLFTNRSISFRIDVTNNVVISQQIFNVATVQLGASLNFGATE
jgi:outer membrane beta-barrel protein